MKCLEWPLIRSLYPMTHTQSKGLLLRRMSQSNLKALYSSSMHPPGMEMLPLCMRSPGYGTGVKSLGGGEDHLQLA